MTEGPVSAGSWRDRHCLVVLFTHIGHEITYADGLRLHRRRVAQPMGAAGLWSLPPLCSGVAAGRNGIRDLVPGVLDLSAISSPLFS